MLNTVRWAALVSIALAALWAIACGGGIGASTTPPVQKTTPSVSLSPSASTITVAQSLSVTIAVSGSPTPTGSVTLSGGTYVSASTPLASGSATIGIPSGMLASGNDILIATYTPDAGSSSAYNGSTGSANIIVQALIVPTLTVTPTSSSITAAQALSVTIAANGGAGKPAVSGAITLTSGSYSSGAVTLANGSASIIIPAGSLTPGNDTLTATYTPDTNGALTYQGAMGTAAVTVTALIAPAVTVTPASNSIGASQPLNVTVAVIGGGSNPTPTGSITLAGGSYSSPATPLTGGSATVMVPSGKLATGNDTLTAAYTPDSYSSSVYTNSSGTASVTVTASTTTYTLTIDSTAPASGIAISANPADNNAKSQGNTPFTLTYGSGSQVALNAAISDNGYTFLSWSGCTSTSGGDGATCNVAMNGNTTVTANYNQIGITSITISPAGPVTIGTQQQFTATVNGTGGYSRAVTWSMSGGGDIASTGTSTAIYNTPYPAPATVTITATSTQDTTKSGSITVSLIPPATAASPALSVDVNTPNTPSENPHAINPYVYGLNGYTLDTASAKIANPGLIRWGGDDISRYNYVTNTTNTASDYFFENFQGAGSMIPNPNGSTSFSQFIQANQSVGAATLGTVPVLGWVANGTQYACSFTQSQFPSQQQFENGCGNGVLSSGANLNGSSGTSANQIALITSQSEPAPSITMAPAPGSVTTAWADSTWAGAWVTSLVNNASFGSGGSGKGVTMWDLDNEPTWWDAVHRDVHPNPFTYDEVTNGGIGTALAIKTADPSALVSGPVIDWWWAYFYSKKDLEAGEASSTGACPGQNWNDPIDRSAHGGVPLIEYYLQQFQKYSQSYGIRLLDYLDIHGYFAPNYNGNSVAFTTAGDTQEQTARMNGTRVFWDPTYTDPNYPSPNYSGAPSTSSNCSPAPLAPQLVPMLKTWVANDYPGTKTGIDEYNFGGLESINGAVVQADILGIFGRQGLDMSALWPAEAYSQQMPGNYAFAMYRNYDGKDSAFGDTYLYATSSGSGGDGEGQLAVYAAQRSSDNAITVIVINKTYGALSSTVSLENFTATSGATAAVYQYSNSNLNAIVQQSPVSVTPPSGGATASTIASYTFPAQSITLFVIPD